MKVTIMSRWDAVFYCYNPHTEPTVMISIYGYDAKVGDLMGDEDAAKVAELLCAYPDTDVIVHCDAGISRSAGIAAAILKHTTGDDSSIFENGLYDPNQWCYQKTLKALAATQTEQNIH